jgi:hypothetical protein
MVFVAQAQDTGKEYALKVIKFLQYCLKGF